LLLLPFAARELTRRWTTITTGENQDAHTNVNVKTAAPESSRKIGEKPCRTRSSSLSRKKLSGGT
jgi:hypothetical protein